MYSLFFINRSKNRAVYAIKSRFYSKPVIKNLPVQRFRQRLYISEFIIPDKLGDAKFRTLLNDAFKQLYRTGVRKIALPDNINKNFALNAGLVPQDIQSIFPNKAFELTLLAINFLHKKLSDIFFIICCDKLTKNVTDVINSLITKTRYIYVDCGEETSALAAQLLQNYGIAVQQAISHPPHQETVLILFSQISNQYLQYLSPNVIININGQEIRDVSNVFVISGATVKIENEFIDELPNGINKYAASALMLENGWLNPEAVKLKDIQCNYIF